MDASEIRSQSQILIESLGYPFNSNLPILDHIKLSRTPDEIAGRILALNACVACSYGFPRNGALAWLEQEEIGQYLSNNEDEYLQGRGVAKQATLQWHVEALWALTWASGYHGNLDFSTSCSNDLVSILPNLKINESSITFRQSCTPRSVEEIARMLDIAYCLHWAVRHLRLQGRHSDTNTRIPDQIIIERRRGLEWLVGDEDWDSVPLDT